MFGYLSWSFYVKLNLHAGMPCYFYFFLFIFANAVLSVNVIEDISGIKESPNSPEVCVQILERVDF